MPHLTSVKQDCMYVYYTNVHIVWLLARKVGRTLPAFKNITLYFSSILVANQRHFIINKFHVQKGSIIVINND